MTTNFLTGPDFRGGSRSEVWIDMDAGSFGASLLTLADQFEHYSDHVVATIEREFKVLSLKWHAGAVKRVPVKTGALKRSLRPSSGRLADEIFAEVSTGVLYASFVELGTVHIAKGRVLALGAGPDVTDQMAVKSWPALEERGGKDQQMPWLRPSFNALRDEFLSRLSIAMKPTTFQNRAA